MKTIMTPNFVTTSIFNRAMKKIDHRFEFVNKRFEAVDKRFDDMEIMIRNCMEEQRVALNNDMQRYIGAIMEEFNGRFIALMEHPVFTNHKA